MVRLVGKEERVPLSLLLCMDRKLAVEVTKAVREKDGGLPAVEALTLQHRDGNMEVRACADPIASVDERASTIVLVYV